MHGHVGFRMNAFINWVSLAALGISLAGCGSSGGSGGGPQYPLRVSVEGLSGTLVLRDGDATLTVLADNPALVFAQYTPGHPYELIVESQPAGQDCSVNGGTGLMPDHAPDPVLVTCSDIPYQVRAAVSGASGRIVLALDDDAPLVIDADGTYLFPRSVYYANHYRIRVALHPQGQRCVVNDGEITVTGEPPIAGVLCSQVTGPRDVGDEEIYARFTAGVPVEGLIFTCGLHKGVTDSRGGFFCPRDSTVTFRVGDPLASSMAIGDVDLKIYGSPSSSYRRTTATVNPGTLHGTRVDGAYRPVLNAFNLLHSIDVGPAGPAQRIVLDDDLRQRLGILGEFDVLVAAGDGITLSGAQFDTYLAAVVQALSDAGRTPRHLAESGQRTLGVALASTNADVAMLKGRAGLYRSARSMVDAEGSEVLVGMTEFLLNSEGRASGYAISEVFAAANSTSGYQMQVLPLGAGAQVRASGRLDSFVYGSGSASFALFGSFVNDALWGESQLCQPAVPLDDIPAEYCEAQAESGGFSLLDAGVFEHSAGFQGEVFLWRLAGMAVEDELSSLPAGYLPKTFEADLGRYSDIQHGDLMNPVLDGPDDDKAAFGPVLGMTRAIRYTLMPSGDVVSDADGDCQLPELVGGQYRDSQDGSPEFLIGHTGRVLAAVPVGHSLPEQYIEFFLNVVDSGHPDFGFTLGIGALFREGLSPIVLDTSSDAIRSMKCDPASRTLCTAVVEWFDNVMFARDVLSVDGTTSTLTPVDAVNYRSVPYFGQVLGNRAVVVAGSGACR